MKRKVIAMTNNWYAGYTYPKAEKKVSNKLTDLGIESFLPLHTVVRQWSDRKKKLEVPLFPNYVFVKVSINNMHLLNHVKQLVHIVEFENKPIVIKDKEIDKIKIALAEKHDVESTSFSIECGNKVRVIDGAFSGLEGLLIRVDDKSRLLVRIEALRQAFTISISEEYLEQLECPLVSH